MKIREIVARISINGKDCFITVRFADEYGYVKETPEVFAACDGTTYLAQAIDIKKVR